MRFCRANRAREHRPSNLSFHGAARMARPTLACRSRSSPPQGAPPEPARRSVSCLRASLAAMVAARLQVERRQRRPPVVVALALPDDQLQVLEPEILDPRVGVRAGGAPMRKQQGPQEPRFGIAAVRLLRGDPVPRTTHNPPRPLRLHGQGVACPRLLQR